MWQLCSMSLALMFSPTVYISAHTSFGKWQRTRPLGDWLCNCHTLLVLLTKWHRVIQRTWPLEGEGKVHLTKGGSLTWGINGIRVARCIALGLAMGQEHKIMALLRAVGTGLCSAALLVWHRACVYNPGSTCCKGEQTQMMVPNSIFLSAAVLITHCCILCLCFENQGKKKSWSVSHNLSSLSYCFWLFCPRISFISDRWHHLLSFLDDMRSIAQPFMLKCLHLYASYIYWDSIGI